MHVLGVLGSHACTYALRLQNNDFIFTEAHRGIFYHPQLKKWLKKAQEGLYLCLRKYLIIIIIIIKIQLKNIAEMKVGVLVLIINYTLI